MKRLLMNKDFITIIIGVISLIINLGVIALIILALIKYITN